MRDIALVAQAFAVFAATAGVYFDLNYRIPKNKRCIWSVVALLTSTIFATISTSTLFIAHNYKWTFTVGFHAFSLALVAYACFVHILLLRRHMSQRNNIVDSSVVKILDNGVKILLIAGQTKLPQDDLLLQIPEGLAPYCTEGLSERYNHSELSIVLELEDGLAEQILTKLIKRISNGERFEHGQTVSEIVSTDVRFYKDTSNPSMPGPLRVIFPDENGRWPEDKQCNPTIAKQILPYEKIWKISKKNGNSEVNRLE